MMKWLRVIAVAAMLAGGGVGQAQEIILKVHHPLPPSSTAHQKVLEPWCEKITAESKGRIKCQIYPSMQLGGSVPQLYDQVKDGVVDVIWTVAGYSAGRFPLVEVFELPFMVKNAESTSKALWDYVRLHDADEFKDVHMIAFHVHGGGVFSMIKKPIVQRSDLRGMKVRAPTRQTTKMLAALGATPVGMPVPQVPEALSKGVIDGTLLPYEVMPALKVDELTRYHSGPAASQPMIYTSVFILAMNKARYDGLPADLKKVIDANSGIGLSAQLGRLFDEVEVLNKKKTGGIVNVISNEEIEQWKKIAQPVIDGWVEDADARGADGKALLKAARDLIAKYSK
ncbi:MAG: TRAP transporter substrate-binding protein [Betaproteobacteria bacterium]|jgi:TRAP-type C4-dicarboxylate transport system substrate-binding protein